MVDRSLTRLLRGVGAHPAARWLVRRLVGGQEHPGNVPETRGMDIERLEDLTHELVNAERINRGLGPLEHVREIKLIARSHSDDMARRDYFSHTSLEGLTPADRGDRAGYDSRMDHGTHYTFGLAENIHQGWLYRSATIRYGKVVHRDWLTVEELAQAAVSGWMASRPHRKNILTGSYEKAGMGAAVSAKGKVYMTQNFC